MERASGNVEVFRIERPAHPAPKSTSLKARQLEGVLLLGCTPRLDRCQTRDFLAPYGQQAGTSKTGTARIFACLKAANRTWPGVAMTSVEVE